MRQAAAGQHAMTTQAQMPPPQVGAHYPPPPSQPGYGQPPPPGTVPPPGYAPPSYNQVVTAPYPQQG